MIPVSGRLPDDLYNWLAVTPMSDASTISDKLRVAVTHLKRIHEGDSDYIGAQSLYRDLLHSTRDQLMKQESQAGHSEVMSQMLDHLPVLMALMTSAQIDTAEAARNLESQLVKRSMYLFEGLLRLALTQHALAYDPNVIRQHLPRALELLRNLPAEGGGLTSQTT